MNDLEVRTGVALALSEYGVTPAEFSSLLSKQAGVGDAAAKAADVTKMLWNAILTGGKWQMAIPAAAITAGAYNLGKRQSSSQYDIDSLRSSMTEHEYQSAIDALKLKKRQEDAEAAKDVVAESSNA